MPEVSQDALNPSGKEAVERVVSLSEAAAKRVLSLAEKKENRGQNFRIAVSGGGCQGFSYGFSFDDTVNEG
ncbi:MAG: iron-sulfur cluster assembly accessory protein, partial [Alphaproteobacteria bacterium]|nr:iron-sulfur cluster assembly accessory protein [Alphaproteobacteria bacterium]